MPHDSFWDFSVRVYRLPQVSQTCLRLQNEHGLDVNLLLFALWYGHRHGALAAALLDAVLAFTRPWAREVVQPLRHARGWMKQALAGEQSALLQERACVPLRERIKAVELQSERLQQEVMEALCQRWLIERSRQHDREDDTRAGQAQTIADNLRAIAEASAVPLTPALQSLLDMLQRSARSD